MLKHRINRQPPRFHFWAAVAGATFTASVNAESNAKHYCYPDAHGQGWQCNAHAAQPVIPQQTTKPAAAVPPDEISASATSITNQNDITEEARKVTKNTAAAPDHPPVQQTAPQVSRKQPSGPYAHLDWVPRAEFTTEQIEEVPPYCTGTYVEPEFLEGEAGDIATEAQPINASAIRSEGLLDGRSTLIGDVVIQQGNRRLETNEAVLNQATKTADVVGSASFREPGILLIGEDAHIELDTNEVTLKNAVFVAHENHMRGTAAEVGLADDVVSIQRGEFTRCEPGVNSWTLRGNRIKLDQEAGTGTARNATLRIRNVPFLYTPYIQFPINDQRKSGLLFPEIGSSSDGAELALPYYFNIAPNYDATFTPRYISDRGTMGELEFRYLHKNNSGTLSGGFLSGDDEFGGEDRWRGQILHRGTLFSDIKTVVNYTTVSDEDYLNDFGTDLETTSQTYVLRLGQASYQREFWGLSAKLMGYQILDEDLSDAAQPYDQLPQLALNIDYPHEATGLEFTLDTTWAYFDRDNASLVLADQARTSKTLRPAVGNRLNANAGIGLNLEWPFAFIRPQVKYKYISYDLDDIDESLDSSPDVGTPVYSIDSGMFFERDISWFGTDLLQTFEPRVFYLNVPEEDQSDQPDFDSAIQNFSYSQMFQDNRFLGGDRIGDADQVSVGLTTRFLDDSGFERLRTSVGQIFYSDDRSVTLTGAPGEAEMTNESAYAAELLFGLPSGWQLRGNIEWDPETERTMENSLSLRYRADNQHILNLGYRARRESRQIEQTNIALVWPLSSRWSFIGRWNRDIINDRNVEALVGLEYQSCCWSARIVGRQWINDDDITQVEGVEEKEGIYLQFQLKGLAGVGESLESILSNSIAGYQEQSDYEF